MAKKKSAPAEMPQRRTLPLVQVAAFCEYVLEEKDGATSVIRMIDAITLRSKPKSDQQGAISVAALVMLKSGEVSGAR